MKLSQFNFKLPEASIAQFPARYPDEAKMMVLHRKSGKIEHKKLPDMFKYFSEHDLFIFNDTQVFPARLTAIKEKTNAKIDVFLLRELNHEMRYWDVLVEPARKIRIGNKLFFDESGDVVAEVIDNTTSRGRTLRFLTDDNPDVFKEKLLALGKTPVPDYISRPITDKKVLAAYEKEFGDQPVDEMDKERYQTIFAAKQGAVSAPATGLHFTKILLKRLEIAGIEYEMITSHCGLGVFKDIEVEDLSKHKMDSEQMMISQKLVDHIDRLHEEERHICAVGTDVMRVLETVAGNNGHAKALDGWTNKFIFPPYDFTIANTMLANFYMPESSQFIMLAAFGGYENVMEAYDIAIKKGYRFGDYGDAMLIVD